MKKGIGYISTNHNVWPCLDTDLNIPNVKKENKTGGAIWALTGIKALFDLFVLGIVVLTIPYLLVTHTDEVIDSMMWFLQFVIKNFKGIGPG